MSLYFALKYLHVIGACALLGTGAGIAFFMLMAHLTGKAATIAAVARIVVIADFVFTATAVVLQPITAKFVSGSVGLTPNRSAKTRPYGDWSATKRKRPAWSRSCTKRAQREQRTQSPSNRIRSGAISGAATASQRMRQI